MLVKKRQPSVSNGGCRKQLGEMEIYMNKRMNRKKLNIGTYFLDDYACTENHVKELSECGIDFVVCMEDKRETLDLFLKYNVGAVVSHIVPFWWSAKKFNPPPGTMAEHNPIADYEKAAESFKDHPAIWGIDCGDEPSALDFKHYGKVMDSVNSRFENQFGYVNLYPNYATVAVNNAQETVSQLGVPTYDKYIEDYCKYVGTDYICYDFYVYSCNVPRMYQNLITVADACTKTGRSMWIVLQVNSHKEEKFISENQLRYQAYTAMAFGAENIIWACYTKGWWHNQVLDSEGNKTEQYDKLKKINAEIKSIADEYMKYRRCNTHFVGFGKDNSELDGVKYESQEQLDTGIFTDFKADGSCVVGEMAGRYDNSHALFVFAAGDSQDDSPNICNVTFNAGERKISLVGTDKDIVLNDNGNGSYSLSIPSNQAVIIKENY